MRTQTIIYTLVVLIILVAGVFLYTTPLLKTQAPTASTATTTATRTKITSVLYACNNDQSIAATYYRGPAAATPLPGQPPVPTGSVDLSLSDGRTLTLAQTLSADGARYSNGDPQTVNGEPFVFWSKGNGALVLENNEQQTYTGCVAVAPQTNDLTQIYHDGTLGITMRYPMGWTASSSYTNTLRGPKYPPIPGVLFHIPTAMASGTNLSAFDTGLSVETIASSTSCSAALFLAQPVHTATTTIGDTEYSVASTTDAAAGNRYETIVYALPFTNPCIGIRYFMHYGAIENYPTGVVHAFDRTTLLKVFDAMRDTFIHAS